jgi:hypothetical protein
VRRGSVLCAFAFSFTAAPPCAHAQTTAPAESAPAESASGAAFVRPDPECLQRIGPGDAQRIYDRLVGYHGDDGCTLKELSTDQSWSTARWVTRDGKELQAFFSPRACERGANLDASGLRASFDDTFALGCPGAAHAMTEALRDQPTLPVAVPPEPAQPSRAHHSWWLAALVAALAVALPAVAVAAVAMGGARTIARRSPGLSPRVLLIVAGLSLLASGIVHAAAHAAGELVDAALRHASPGWFLLPAALFVAFVLLLAACRFFATRIHATVEERAVVAAAVCAAYFGGGYWATIERGPSHRLGAVLTVAPGMTYRESFPQRPKVLYHLDEHGMRGSDWTDRKEPGVIRVVVIGDSFVFGAGVEDDDTLPRKLAAKLAADYPGRKFEVLNLGQSGDNLTSHVEMYEYAQSTLDPDFAVICLTIPNDLTRWDDVVARRDLRRPSLYGVSTFLIGRATVRIWGSVLLEDKNTPEGEAFFGEQLDRLDAIRRGHEDLPLLLFAYNPQPHLLERAVNRPGVVVVPPPAVIHSEYFISGDGHPTGAGNAVFAGLIETTAVATARWRDRVEAAAR